MRRLLIFALFATVAFAQQPPPKPPTVPKFPAVSPVMFHFGLNDVTIPEKCSKPLLLPLHHIDGIERKPTCGVFLSFAGKVPQGEPVWFMKFKTWDNAGASTEDSIYRIYLYNPSWRGITVYGRPGHRILLEVQYR